MKAIYFKIYIKLFLSLLLVIFTFTSCKDDYIVLEEHTIDDTNIPICKVEEIHLK